MFAQQTKSCVPLDPSHHFDHPSVMLTFHSARRLVDAESHNHGTNKAHAFSSGDNLALEERLLGDLDPPPPPLPLCESLPARRGVFFGGDPAPS